MELIDASYPDDHYDGDLSWINFQGRWGNIQKIVSQTLFRLPNFLNYVKIEYCVIFVRVH